MMKSLICMILFILGLSVSPLCMGSAENPNVSNSFRANTTVPSEGRQRRLLTSPNPMSRTSSNDVITGNVGGLGYFHGVVPYGSSYYNRADLNDPGTAAVSSFLRRSVNPILSDRNPGQTRAYYEPSRAVSSFNIPSIHRAASAESVTTGLSSKSTYLTELPELSRTEAQQRPLSSDNAELDRILARQFELKEKAKESTQKILQKQTEDFRNIFDIPLEPEQIDKPESEQEQTIDTQQEQLTETPEKPGEEPLLKPLENPLQENIIKPGEEPQTELEMQIPQHFPVEQPIPTEEEKSVTDENGKSMVKPEGIDFGKVQARVAEHAEAERIRGEHKTLESLSQARFIDYMQAAEEFMRKGEYYKAADTYSLASLWKPNDPRTYMAQSFALFAAGEYMSSAYYLTQAIDMDQAMATKQYDLPALIGDRDVFENRLIELTTWQQRSGSGELAFLMAYVLYHDGQTAKAVKALRQAIEKMPENPAVSSLKDVLIPESGTSPK